MVLIFQTIRIRCQLLRITVQVLFGSALLSLYAADNLNAQPEPVNSITLSDWKELSSNTEPRDEEITERLLNSYEDNLRQLAHVRLDMRTVIIDRDASDPAPGVYVIERSDGQKVTLTRPPAPAETRARCFLSASELVFVNVGEDGNAAPYYSFDGNVWKEYAPDVKRMTIRRPDQMPSFVPLDVRNAVAPDNSWSLLKALHDGAIRSSADANDLTSNVLSVSELGRADTTFYKVTWGFSDRRTLAVSFSSKVRFLPIESILFNGDQMIRRVEMTYSNYEARQALIPSTVVQSYYRGNTRPELSEIDKWIQQVRSEVVAVTTMSEEEWRDIISIAAPASALVHDHSTLTADQVFTAPVGFKVLDNNGLGVIRLSLIAINSFVVIGLLVVVYLRRLRQST